MKKSASTRGPRRRSGAPRHNHRFQKTKSSPNVLMQEGPTTAGAEAPVMKHKTEIAVRLNEDAKRNARTSGRSQDVVPLQKDCEGMRQTLRQVIDCARKYQQSLKDVDHDRKMVSISNTPNDMLLLCLSRFYSPPHCSHHLHYQTSHSRFETLHIHTALSKNGNALWRNKIHSSGSRSIVALGQTQ